MTKKYKITFSQFKNECDHKLECMYDGPIKCGYDWRNDFQCTEKNCPILKKLEVVE